MSVCLRRLISAIRHASASSASKTSAGRALSGSPDAQNSAHGVARILAAPLAPPARLARSSDLTLALDPGLPAPPLAGLAQPHLSSCVCPVRRLQSTSSCKPASSPRPPSSSRRRSACRCSSRRRCASTCSSPSSTSPRRWRRCCWASTFVLGFACNVVVLSAIGVSPRFCSRARLPPSHPPTHARTHTRARSDPPPAQTACPRPRRTSSSS